MVGENTDAPAASMNSIIAYCSTGLRPYLSLTGPRTNWPTARPIIPIVRPNWTVGMLVWKNRTIDGSAGWYISLTKDPKADRPTRNNTKKV